jgi:hypothetical protein
MVPKFVFVHPFLTIGLFGFVGEIAVKLISTYGAKK